MAERSKTRIIDPNESESSPSWNRILPCLYILCPNYTLYCKAFFPLGDSKEYLREPERVNGFFRAYYTTSAPKYLRELKQEEIERVFLGQRKVILIAKNVV